jgi:hypothetical protein
LQPPQTPPLRKVSYIVVSFRSSEKETTKEEVAACAIISAS